MVMLSLPSPPAQWRSFNIGEWLRSLGFDWFTVNLAVNAYALFILLGITLALVVANAILVRRGAEPWVVIDVALYTVPLGILGGRLFHVAINWGDYVYPGADLWRILYIWEGGLAIFGAVILGAVGVWIGCRVTGLRFWSVADAMAPGMLIAQGVGRFGNWFNQELFGAPTDLPWGLEIDPGNRAIPAGLPAETLFHPLFLYEMLWNFTGAIALLLLLRRLNVQWGQLFAGYLIWYSVGRFFMEFIRLDANAVFSGLRVNQWAALAAIVLGLLIIAIQRSRHPGKEPSVYRPGKEWIDETEVESEERWDVDEMLASETEKATSKSTTSGPSASAT